MAKPKYTKKQIVEAIKHWQGVLQRIDESKNELLQALFAAFNTNDLLKDNVMQVTDSILNKCYEILNIHFFESKLNKIPLIYESDSEIRKFLISRKTNAKRIPNVFFGVHSVICDNDKISNWNEKLALHDDAILLNSSYIEHKSIAFLIACLCHEMIHYYDRLFGEYCGFVKYKLMTGIEKNKHNTMTFENMKEKANDLGINVIQEIPKEKNPEILDKEAIELLFKKAQEDGLILEDEDQRQDTQCTSFFKDHSGCVINTF